jgi:hypothetical protein
MIKITIEKLGNEKYTTRENLLKKKTPTQIKGKTGYGEREEVQDICEYEVAEVVKFRDTKQTLLTQEITDDSAFDLAAVIVAINRIAIP